jgi:hypothetical protein
MFLSAFSWAKFHQNRKKYEILTLYPGYDGMVKKPSHATVPLRLLLLTVSDVLESLLLGGDHAMLRVAPHVLVDVALVHLHLPPL